KHGRLSSLESLTNRQRVSEGWCSNVGIQQALSDLWTRTGRKADHLLCFRDHDDRNARRERRVSSTPVYGSRPHDQAAVSPAGYRSSVSQLRHGGEDSRHGLGCGDRWPARPSWILRSPRPDETGTDHSRYSVPYCLDDQELYHAGSTQAPGY